MLAPAETVSVAAVVASADAMMMAVRAVVVVDAVVSGSIDCR
jgi:hypothetical protein